jgi:hypothetical protein
MTDRPELPRIEVPADVAEAAGMPGDLDANVVGPYAVPDTARRRRAGLVYVVAAILVALGIMAGLPPGMWLTVAGFAAIALYHMAAGTRLEVREHRALDIANQATEFPVGHASAALGFDGFLARPVWNVLVFSTDDPPSMRGLVRVSGSDGSIVEHYAEAVPAEPAAGTG